MTDKEVKLVIGSLLHDIGKVIYREGGDKRKHSQSGYDYLKEEIGIEEKEILSCVRYHHKDAIANAAIEKDSLAYIVYIADNIASAADRRKRDSEDVGFEISMPLQSVFNILNGNRQEMYYQPKTLDDKDGINYPSAEKRSFDEQFYRKVLLNLTDNLKGSEWSKEYVNSLLEVLEANLSYVPSSTAKGELADISLFDHVKLTAAIASCIHRYLEEKGNSDYRETLFTKEAAFYQEKVFCLWSMDISGIQDFIYTIVSENALRTLRARSFYLEVMMEHIIDCFLDRLHLSRANLIYSGGGHCYILMPASAKAKKDAEGYMQELNNWLTEQFDISLYVAWGSADCSADHLKNIPQGSYSEIFRKISRSISEKKNHRYSAEDIRKLNRRKQEDYTRECSVCKRLSKTDEEGVCPVCRAIERFSGKILYDEFFTVTLEKREEGLPLPGNYYLVSDNEATLKEKMKRDDYFVRAYGKNKMFTGKHIATKLWVGDYTTGKTFGEYAKEAEGIDRIGILRADVDNLGQAFVAGFENPENENRYVTLSRTATLSRQLSQFFKYHINKILENGSYHINGKGGKPRSAAICYSGGDDVFIVGAWNEVLELAVDLRRCFERYTEGTLTISAGIGLYEEGYPVSASARETARLEDAAKSMPGKNSVAVFTEEGGVYGWKEFEESVLGEKLSEIYEFFRISEERGKSFLYHLLELLREQEEKINFARYVYVLSRLEPPAEANREQKEAYRRFSRKMCEWRQNEKDCRELITAISIYVYLKRETEGTKDERNQ